jgi:hypothetical protein
MVLDWLALFWVHLGSLADTGASCDGVVPAAMVYAATVCRCVCLYGPIRRGTSTLYATSYELLAANDK